MKNLLLLLFLVLPCAASAQSESETIHQREVQHDGQPGSRVEDVIKMQQEQIDMLVRELQELRAERSRCVAAVAPVYIYCKINGNSTLSSKLRIDVDYGQPSFTLEDTKMRDEKGKLREFNSMINALNWFATQGWELQESYTSLSDGESGTRFYILRRNVAGLSEQEIDDAYSIFRTKRDFK